MIVILVIIHIGLVLAGQLVEAMIRPSMGVGNRASRNADADMRAFYRSESRARRRRYRSLNYAARVDVLRRALDNPDLPARRALFGDADFTTDDGAEHEGSHGVQLNRPRVEG